jgi:hypothetical protein
MTKMAVITKRDGSRELQWLAAWGEPLGRRRRTFDSAPERAGTSARSRKASPFSTAFCWGPAPGRRTTMSFRFRVYLADSEDLDDYVSSEPNWRPGDTLYIEGEPRYRISAPPAS